LFKTTVEVLPGNNLASQHCSPYS